MKVKHLQAPTEFKDINEDGTFSGYASIFGNVDLGGDIVERGAFARGDMELTKDGMVRIADAHNLRVIIGKAKVEQDDVGLKFDGQLLLGLNAAREAHLRMKAGVLDGMSIGYDPIDEEVMNSGVRKLKRLKLYEISPVTFGMNPLARIDTVKAMEADLSTAMGQLRDAMRSCQQCMGMTSDNDPDDAQMRAMMTAMMDQMKAAYGAMTDRMPMKSRKVVTNIREFEDLLREDCGFSNSQAKLLASGGYPLLLKAREESRTEEGSQQIDGLISFVKSITKSVNS